MSESSFGESNRAMLESGFLADIELDVGLPHCDNKLLSAHKYILVSRSPVFKAMFSHNFKEGDATRVKIDEDVQIFKQILE